MAETLKGLGLVWGVGGLTFTGVAIDTSGKLQSANFTFDADKEQLTDASGEVAAEVYYNQKKTLDLTIIPSAASIATAETNASTLLPAPGTLVTVVDADTTVVDGSNSGKYVVQSAKMNRTNRGVAAIDISLMQYVANDISATVSS